VSEATPQSPHPVRPISLRSRGAARAAASCSTVTWISAPSLTCRTAIETISSASATMPSVREKPQAKSSRSAGVAIITAWTTLL
jgi:hypothetical protein